MRQPISAVARLVLAFSHVALVRSAPASSGGVRGLQSIGTTCEKVTVDFTPFAKGDNVVDGVALNGGITIKARRFNDNDKDYNDAMIFDALEPSGRDTDLSNFHFLGKMLIISENNDSSDPDDAAKGGQIKIEFPDKVTIHSIRFIDVENMENGDDGKSELGLFDENGIKIRGVKIPGMLNGGQKVMSFSEEQMGLRSIIVNLRGSGAIDDIVFSPDECDARSSPTLSPTSYSENCCNLERLRNAQDRHVTSSGCSAETYAPDYMPTSFCCHDGGWDCFDDGIDGARAFCSNELDDRLDSDWFSDDGRGPIPLYLQQGPICGGCEGLSEVDIKELGLMCGEGRECPRDAKTCADGSLVYRDPSDDCQYRRCPEDGVGVCCNPGEQPLPGRWVGDSPAICLNDSFCCPSGNWGCSSTEGATSTWVIGCFSPFSGRPMDGDAYRWGPVCDNPCPTDTKSCPNTSAVFVRDPLLGCEFPPCPDNVKCCDASDKAAMYDTPECQLPEYQDRFTQYDVEVNCCPDGTWTCAVHEFYVLTSRDQPRTTYCEAFDRYFSRPTGVPCM